MTSEVELQNFLPRVSVVLACFFYSGNEETIPFTRARPLEAKFKTLPPQAQEARLS